ncbi:MAG: Crp/Fnr family transcriptional regulator [Acidobacteriota bacterium]
MSLPPTSLLPSVVRGERNAFSHLPPETLADLDAISKGVEYRDEATLMRQGDAPQFVKILLDGRAKISTASQDGKVLLLNFANAGTILGLVSAIRQIKFETTAEAYGHCLVNEIDGQEFLDFLHRHRNACWQVTRMLADENHELLVNARRVALSGTVAGNIAKLLLDWGATVNEIDGRRHFNMVLTHQEIAEMVGTTRETVTRTLASFRQSGWIRIHGASVELLQQEKMKGIAI